jgi:anti-sigma factor RsiW
MTGPHPGDALHAYLDNELGAERALELRAHLASCEACRREYEAMRALRGVLQRTLLPGLPPPGLVHRLERAVRRAQPTRWHTRTGRVLLAAGPLAAALVLVVGLQGPSFARPDVAAEVVGAHLRSLQASHLTDVASSDRHTLKPWFQGKVPFAPPVKDLQAQGLRLEGGRLDVILGQPAAALVYRVRQHPINVLVWADAQAPDAEPRTWLGSGLTAVHWTASGLQFWAVSDASEEDLRRLAEGLRGP